jgi:hypothetical protein
VDSSGSNPRLLQADKRLIEASRELLYAVRLYQKSLAREDVGAALIPDDLATVESVQDPEQLSRFIQKTLEEQKHKKMSVSTRFGGIIGKVSPLLSLTLGGTSAIAEGATFVPVKGAVNALSLLLTVGLLAQSRLHDLTKGH